MKWGHLAEPSKDNGWFVVALLHFHFGKHHVTTAQRL